MLTTTKNRIAFLVEFELPESPTGTWTVTVEDADTFETVGRTRVLIMGEDCDCSRAGEPCECWEYFAGHGLGDAAAGLLYAAGWNGVDLIMHEQDVALGEAFKAGVADAVGNYEN